MAYLNMDWSFKSYHRSAVGWGRLALGGIRVIDIPASPSTVLPPDAEPPMAAKLLARLEEVNAEEGVMGP
jgi:hypothetical protein